MPRFRTFAASGLLAFVSLLPLLGLAGCISFSSSDSSPPPNSRTIVVPAGTTVTCSPTPCPVQ